MWPEYKTYDTRWVACVDLNILYNKSCDKRYLVVVVQELAPDAKLNWPDVLDH